MIAIQILGTSGASKAFRQEVGMILEKHLPAGTLISVQGIEARTVRELNTRS